MAPAVPLVRTVVALPWALLLAAGTAAIAAVLACSTVLMDLLYWPWVGRGGRTAGPAAPPPGGVRKRVSAITVSWNGRHFLTQLLPSLRAELERFEQQGEGRQSEIVVVDNGSTDGTVAWLAEEWPEVRVVALPENQFFVRGAMAGVAAARFETLLVLNNDMIVEPGFLPALLEPLAKPGVFGVSSQIFLQDPKARREETGLTGGGFRRGVLKLAHLMPEGDQLCAPTVPTLWAGGGSSAYDRAAFTALGGFDTLYDPFYVEDMALSYGAWSRGWQVLFAADSRVRHAHRGTSRKAFGDRYVDGMIRRNQHLFTWKMVTSWRFTIGALATIPLVVLVRWRGPHPFAGPWFEASALLRALPRFPRAVVERQGQRRRRRRADRAVLATAASIHLTSRAVALAGATGGAPAVGADSRKLLFLAGRMPQRGVDGSWVLLDLMLGLAARGHRLTLLAMVESEAERALATPLEAAGVRVEVVVRRPHPAVGNLHHQSPPRLARDYSHPDLAAAAARLLRVVDFDLVQVDYVEMAHIAAPLLAGLRSVYVCHESAEVAARRSGGGWFEVTRARLHERGLVRRFQATVCLTDADAEVVARSATPEQVVTIPSAIALEPWDQGDGTAPTVAPTPPTPTATTQLLFVGSFAHPPNRDAVRWLVNEILPLVRRQVPATTLRIVGAGAPAELVAAAGDGVEFAGFVPDLVHAHRDAAVVVVPLRLGGGIRSKVLEAWAGRKAVVATSVAAAGLGVVDGEQMLLADSAAAFAAAVVRCLEDPPLRDRLGAAGRRRVEEEFARPAQVQAYEALYTRLIGERP